MAPSDQNLTRRVDGLESQAGYCFRQDRPGLSDSVDRRFEHVDAAFVEQRQYTEFAYQRLDAKDGCGGFSRLEGHVGRLEGHIGRVERKVDQLIDMIQR